MNRRQMLASVAAGSAAAMGATAIAGADAATGSADTYYRITQDDAGERTVRAVSTDDVDLESEDTCYADCCQYCPPDYVCSVCICQGRCPIE